MFMANNPQGDELAKFLNLMQEDIDYLKSLLEEVVISQGSDLQSKWNMVLDITGGIIKNIRERIDKAIWEGEPDSEDEIEGILDEFKPLFGAKTKILDLALLGEVDASPASSPFLEFVSNVDLRELLQDVQESFETQDQEGQFASLHTLLDLAGFIPLVGELADGINAIIYLAEGDVGNAGISVASLLPGGDLAKGLRILGASAVVTRLSGPLSSSLRAFQRIGGRFEDGYRLALQAGEYGEKALENAIEIINRGGRIIANGARMVVKVGGRKFMAGMNSSGRITLYTFGRNGRLSNREYQQLLQKLGLTTNGARRNLPRGVIRDGWRKAGEALNEIGYRQITLQVGSETIGITKRDMQHILTRHHPDFWTGEMKSTQSFFDRISVRETVNLIRSIIDKIQSNRNLLDEVRDILRNRNGWGSIEVELSGTLYKVSFGEGHIERIFPLN
jgi:hypothetical protein